MPTQRVLMYITIDVSLICLVSSSVNIKTVLVGVLVPGEWNYPMYNPMYKLEAPVSHKRKNAYFETAAVPVL